MKLYFYFSSPAKGYGFICVDPQTGETLAAGKAAAEMLNGRIYNMVADGGMSAALFRMSTKMGFVAKNLCTPGNSENMAVVLENGEEGLARALAACTLYRYEELCRAVAACTGIDEEQGTGVVHANAVLELLRFACTAQPPQGREDAFEKIAKAGTYAGRPYVMLIVNPTLEYFAQAMRMPIDKQMIGLLMNEAEFRALRIGAPVHTAVKAEKPASPVMSMKPVMPVKRVEVKPAVSAKSAVPEKPAVPMKSETDDQESINLLDYKWFLPAVGGIAAVLILAIVLIVGAAIRKDEVPAEPASAAVEMQQTEEADPKTESTETQQETTVPQPTEKEIK